MRCVSQRLTATVGVLLVAMLAACGGAVTEPEPLGEGDLDRPEAQQGLLNGMARTLSSALGWLGTTGAVVSRELGGAGGAGITDGQLRGLLVPGPREGDEYWQRAQQARWVAEDGVRRLRRVLGEGFASSPVTAQALVYAGYANRLLGENMCQAVIDGGPAEPRRVSFERAEAAFTEAIEIAGRIGDGELGLAARAGRASARVGLGDWAGAVADAEAVPQSFVYQARFSAIELEQYNKVYWSDADDRALNVWGTFYDAYYAETGDPRTPWASDPGQPVNEKGDPWHFETKYDRRDSPINLVSGVEMRLLVAEARLRAGDAQGALEIVNALRADVGVPPWSAVTLEEAWTALKRERGIVLWLEGRRLWDLHRWLAEGTPGTAEDMTGRSTCFPIGQSEVNSNPHLGS